MKTRDPTEIVAEIRAKRPGFGGGSGRKIDDTGAAWYDAEIYPGDTYPVLPRVWFAKLKGGCLIGPGWRGYDSQEEADCAAIEAARIPQGD